MQQLNFFLHDVRKTVGRDKTRYLIVWLSPVFWGLLRYRVDRQLFLFWGRSYRFIRLPFYPFFILLENWSRLDIHYKANIGGGIKILHNACGIVISGQSVIGRNLVLTGGNIIGGKAAGVIDLGEGVSFGANASLIGPLKIGNNVSIGAGACVVKDCLEDNSVLVGVPARKIK
jgi:serine O-acetyltransferase